MCAQESEKRRSPVAAFILSLLGGLWMLSSSGMMYGGLWYGSRHAPHGVHMGRTMWDWGMMRALGSPFSWPWFGSVAGLVVIVGAVIIFARPEYRRGWGIAIVVASALNLFIGAGGFLGPLMAIIGGILALTWQGQSTSQPTQP